MNIYIAENQIWYTCIKLGVKVHLMLEFFPNLKIEVKSIYEASRFLARNVSLSWRVTLCFLVLFCRSYSGRWTSLGRQLTRKHCSCWQGASLWTYTRCCNVTEKEERLLEMLIVWRQTQNKDVGTFLRVFQFALFILIIIKQLISFWLQGCYCAGAISGRF